MFTPQNVVMQEETLRPTPELRILKQRGKETLEQLWVNNTDGEQVWKKVPVFNQNNGG
jgi:hypothetical protein